MHYFISPLLITSLALLTATGLDWDETLTWHDQHRIGQIGLLSLVALGVLTIWRQDGVATVMQLPHRIKLPLAWAWGLGGVSVVAAAYPRFAALEWATLLLLLGLALLLAAQARLARTAFDIWAMRLIVTLACVIALKIMTGYVAAMVVMKHLDSIMLFEGTFSNRRFFGQVASLVVPLLAYPLLREALSKRARVALFALLAIWWMLVIVSGTRGTWMAMAAAAVVLSAVAWRTCAGWLKVQALAFVAGALMFWILFVWLPSLVGSAVSLEARLGNLAHLSGREVLWSIAWTQIQAHPWLGIGPMHLASIHNNFGAHPHNAPLQLAAEWGIPAALALFFPVVVGLLCLLKKIRRQETLTDPLLVCLTASLLAASAQSMVDGVIVIPYTQILVALVAGWALGAYSRGGTEPPPTRNSYAIRWGISITSMIALASFLYGVFPEILNRAEITQAYVDTGNPLVPPRFWAVGWIP